MTREPLYKQMEAWLRDEAHRRGPNALMPSVSEVLTQFDSRGVKTVAQAYAPLLADHIVEQRGRPRRFVVVAVNSDQETPNVPDATEILSEIESSLQHISEMVASLRRQLPATDVVRLPSE